MFKGAVILLFFVILAGVRDSIPLNETFFLSADISSFHSSINSPSGTQAHLLCIDRRLRTMDTLGNLRCNDGGQKCQLWIAYRCIPIRSCYQLQFFLCRSGVLPIEPTLLLLYLTVHVFVLLDRHCVRCLLRLYRSSRALLPTRFGRLLCLRHGTLQVLKTSLTSTKLMFVGRMCDRYCCCVIDDGSVCQRTKPLPRLRNQCLTRCKSLWICLGKRGMFTIRFVWILLCRMWSWTT